MNYRERFIENLESRITYDYDVAIREDVAAWIEDQGGIREIMKTNDLEDREDLEQYLNDALFCEDSVTGNASGSYWFSCYKAQCALAGNFSLLRDAIEEFGGGYDKALESEESADVTIRCYLLGSAIYDVLNEIYDEEEEDSE